MAACPDCGEENPARGRFCYACGAELPADDFGVDLQIRKTITVLFCDLAGSTELGERHDPERLRLVVSRFFAEMQRVLERHGGTVEKFIGDAVMAVFGHPVAHEDDALRAVRAAAEMRQALTALNEDVELGSGIRLEARIGINTGEVVAGDLSRGHGFVTGDAVNVAKRLEEGAGPGEVVLGAGTHALVGHAVTVEALAPLALKGKQLPVAAYRLVAVLPEAPGFARWLDAPLVDRERELAALEFALARTIAERRCRLTLLLGPAGIGKTRLVDELVARADGVRLVRGRCLAYGEGITFRPVAEAVRQTVGLGEAETPEEARAKVEALFPAAGDGELVYTRLARVLGLDGPAAPTEEIFWAVRKLLEALAVERPVLAVFDDVQWAEPTLLDLLEYLGGFSREVPILVCCLARPELIDARPAWATAECVELEALGEDESSLLVGSLLGPGDGLAEPVRKELVRTAGGNPLFLEQLVATVGEEGGARPTLPPTIQALLSARLDRLELAERAVIERAAVVGQVFSWAAVADLSPPALRQRVSAHLQSLVRRDLLRPAESPVAGEDAFAFSHVLVRDAAYAGLPKEVRADLHEACARRLERRGAESVGEFEELVGYHLEQAVRYRRELSRRDEHTARLAGSAGELLALAGRRALERGDAPAAANLLERAAALLSDDDAKRSAALLELTLALRDRGELGRAEDVVEQAEQAALAAGDERLQARAELERAILGIYTSPGGAGDELLSLVDRVVPLLESAEDDEGLAKAWYLVGAVHWERCRAGSMGHVLERALEHARRAGSSREFAFVLNGLARALLVGPTPVDVALGRCAEILAESAGDRTQAAIVSTWVALLEAMHGDFEAARRRAADAGAVLEELGQTLRAAALRGYVATIEELAGDLPAAERLYRSALEALEPLGERLNVRTVAARLAYVLVELGQEDEAERFARLARGECAGGRRLDPGSLARGAGAGARAHRRARRGGGACEGSCLAGRRNGLAEHAGRRPALPRERAARARRRRSVPRGRPRRRAALRGQGQRRLGGTGTGRGGPGRRAPADQIAWLAGSYPG